MIPENATQEEMKYALITRQWAMIAGTGKLCKSCLFHSWYTPYHALYAFAKDGCSVQRVSSNAFVNLVLNRAGNESCAHYAPNIQFVFNVSEIERRLLARYGAR